MAPFRVGVPKILLFCWDHRDRRLSDSLDRLPAEIASISLAEVPSAIEEMSNPAVVACVFVVSRESLAEPRFGQALQACGKVLSSRKEFRFFVHLAGISRQQLIEIAQSVPAAWDLLDSVHIGESSEQEQADNLADSVEEHLQQLPEILDYQKYEKWKRIALGLVPLSNLAFAVVLSVAWWSLATRTQETIDSAVLPWILATIGVVFYFSFLAICSFGSSLRAGAVLRWAMALLPLWIINIIPSSKLVASWPYLVVGFGAGALLDSSRRAWAQSRRKQFSIAPPTQEEIEGIRRGSGGWRWRTLTTAPVLGSDPSVFISYSRASPWGSSTALALHQAVQAVGVPSFLDVEGIAEGTSWRHKLQQAIGRASVFISVQDSLTAARYWPSAELQAALRSQDYCGLPSIILLRDATLADGTRATDPVSLLDALLSRKGPVDPTLLRVIDFKADTPRHLAGGLYNLNAASIVNPLLSTLFAYALRPVRVGLSALGTVGVGISVLASILWLVCLARGIRVELWLDAHRLSVPAMVLAGFLLGFILRLVFAARFEVLGPEAPQSFWVHLGAMLPLWWMLWMMARTQAPLSVVFACVIAGGGFLLACDFVSNSLPASGKYRPPPG